MLAPLLDLLAPVRCVACLRRGAVPWCDACAREVGHHRLVDVCGRCAGPRAPGHACWRPGAGVSSTRAMFAYLEVVADSLGRAKAQHLRSVWTPIGAMLGGLVGSVDLITWVPSTPRARRVRGYDHAELLARAAGVAAGRPVLPALRARPHPDQARRRPDRRAFLPAGVFRPTRRLDGARVALVDDVLTTGATAGRAALALGRAGASRVEMVVVARAGSHRLGPLDPSEQGRDSPLGRRS